MSNKIIAEDFKLKKENKKNFKKSIIERGNITNEFTLEDIENHQTDLDKQEKETVAQIKLSSAVVENVERNHPTVSKMSDDQLSAAHYLFETKTILSKSNTSLKSIRATKKKYKEVVDTIMDKFGFVKTNLEKDESAE